jgi:hypothetical protein
LWSASPAEQLHSSAAVAQAGQTTGQGSAAPAGTQSRA